MNEQTGENEAKKLSVIVLTGCILSLLGFIVFFLSGLGYKWDIWDLGTGFDILEKGYYAAGAGFIISLAGAFITYLNDNVRGFNVAIIGIVAGILIVGTTVYFKMRINNNPHIHDITTDTQNSPEFISLREIREDAPNQVEYPGDSIARIQQNHYPDIKPLLVDIGQREALERAVRAAKALSWKIHSVDTADTRLEATDIVPWFGFKDDVIIRITQDSTSGKSRIDIRSVSRIGGSDLGENARRIHRFIEQFKNTE